LAHFFEAPLRDAIGPARGDGALQVIEVRRCCAGGGERVRPSVRRLAEPRRGAESVSWSEANAPPFGALLERLRR
jgi:hypothetical protein